jgi:hypothetical protein|uniref:Uncharacterized protein n=1 Tax=viral metagenome TaxID=1070528 RepID=A0A6C0ISM8_9ZZZZ
MDVNDEWELFLEGGDEDNADNTKETNTETGDVDIDKCEELYISTKTKVLYLNQQIDITNIFWHIPIIPYHSPNVGIIKKQIKLNFNTPEEYSVYREKLKDIPYYTENELKHIDNPDSRKIKFKDERKITVGISKKDIMNCRSKAKNAFYNCFALIARFKYQDSFREIHIKVFNTGKLEIPGILDNNFIDTVKHIVLTTIQPHVDTPLDFINTDKEQNVLINSNFNCGFYIDRERLNCILKSKYHIETAYDPCSYPGVKCKYYYNNLNNELNQPGTINTEDRNMTMSQLDKNKQYTEVSFMVFRTGSCLIVGNCTETILRCVYAFIKQILLCEYKDIMIVTDEPIQKVKKEKIRKKLINVSMDYYKQHIISGV